MMPHANVVCFSCSSGALICFTPAQEDQPTSATTIRNTALAGLTSPMALSQPMVALTSLDSHVAMALDLIWASVVYVQLLPHSYIG